MVAPTLQTYTYQYKDTGILLNGGVALPSVDITKITGLDMGSVDSIINDVDGVHGGSVYSKFMSARTIVLDGDVYAAPDDADGYCDQLISNFIIDDIDYPFYFKGAYANAAIAQRYIMAKSLGVKFDIDRLRAYGRTPIQLQLAAGDPRKYIDNANTTMVAGTGYNIVNLGNANSYPVITITGAFTVINLTNNTTARTVTLTTTRSAGDITVVNFADRSVTINGIRNSSVVTTNNWWDIAPLTTTSIKFTVTGTPTSVVAATKQAWA